MCQEKFVRQKKNCKVNVLFESTPIEHCTGSNKSNICCTKFTSQKCILQNIYFPKISLKVTSPLKKIYSVHLWTFYAWAWCFKTWCFEPGEFKLRYFQNLANDNLSFLFRHYKQISKVLSLWKMPLEMFFSLTFFNFMISLNKKYFSINYWLRKSLLWNLFYTHSVWAYLFHLFTSWFHT